MASPAIPIHPRAPDDPPSTTPTVVPTGAATSMTGAATSPILHPETIVAIGQGVKAAMGDGGGTNKGIMQVITLLVLAGLWVHTEVSAAKASAEAAQVAVAKMDERVKNVERSTEATAVRVERVTMDVRRNTELLEFLAERLLPGTPIPRNNP